MPKLAKVIFPRGFDDRGAMEITDKGYVHTLIETEGARYSVWFFDPVRSRQELESYAQTGDGFFTEQGALVLIPEVTIEAIVRAATGSGETPISSILETN